MPHPSRRSLRTGLTLAALALAFACGGGGDTPSTANAGGTTPAAGAEPAAAAAVPSGPTGTLAGVVTYDDGDADTVIRMDADPVCQQLHPNPVETETLVKDAQGHLANVFVYVKDGLQGRWAPPAETVTLQQRGCVYTPHVAAAMVGQKVKIVNDDPTLHNVHGMAKVNEEFNQGQPFQGMELEKTFDKPEIGMRFKCDVHPWMLAYLHVMPNPFFAVTREDGSFTIPNLPPGTYTVEAWHEQLGTREGKATVAANGTATLDFTFKPAA